MQGSPGSGSSPGGFHRVCTDEQASGHLNLINESYPAWNRSGTQTLHVQTVERSYTVTFRGGVDD